MTQVLRRVGGGGVFVVLFSLLSFLVIRVFPPVGALEIQRAARDFATAWQNGALDKLTYDPASGPSGKNGEPDAIKEDTDRLVRGISSVDDDRPSSVATTGEPQMRVSGEATQALTVTWQLDSNRAWKYQTQLTMRNSGNRWRVLWQPSTVHPYLKPGLLLPATRIPAARAPIPDAAAGVLTATGPAGQLVGEVQTATEKLADIAATRVVPGDRVGISGLQQLYDERLAGQGGVEVDITTDPKNAPLQPVVRQVFVSPPTPGKPLVLTLSSPLQQKAENALRSAALKAPASLVAVDTEQGNVLAVANVGPVGQAANGLTGQYPPGAVFRLPTMLALIRNAGVTETTQADCRPARYLGQQFANPGTVSAAALPFGTTLAQNCVTGFVAAARSLTGGQLHDAARSLGYDVPSSAGVPVFAGTVPPTTDPLELVQNAIGEGTVLASPLAVARASATVATGRYRASTLVTQPPQPVPAQSPELSIQERDVLQRLMADSVRADPAQRRLAALGADQVAAISGVAAYGPAAGAPRNAWCTGYRDGIAFAVLVTNATGAEQAADIAAAFLT